MINKCLIILSIILTIIIAGCDQIKQTSNTTIKTDYKNPNISYEDLGKHFSGHEGCFVLFDSSKEQYIIHNEEKSRKQVSPCSTFKIVNSLIGLETKILENENTIFTYDANKNFSKNWNNKLSPSLKWDGTITLKQAALNSVVWYFQELASRIGSDKMQEYINKLNYGNKDISGGITTFWLGSTLKISPMEQVNYLKKFYTYQLPCSKRSIDIVKSLFILSNENNTILFGKTGTDGSPEKGATNGWFVGYVLKNNIVYYFATNADTLNGNDVKDITLKILKAKEIL